MPENHSTMLPELCRVILMWATEMKSWEALQQAWLGNFAKSNKPLRNKTYSFIGILLSLLFPTSEQWLARERERKKFLPLKPKCLSKMVQMKSSCFTLYIYLIGLIINRTHKFQHVTHPEFSCIFFFLNKQSIVIIIMEKWYKDNY